MDFLNSRFFYKYHGFIYISFWIIILICYILKNTLITLLVKIFSSCMKDKEEEEWFREPLVKVDATSFSVNLPKGTTYFYINLKDENEFLVSYPSTKGLAKKKADFIGRALKPEKK